MRRIVVIFVLLSLLASGVIFKLYTLMTDNAEQTLTSGGRTSITIDGGYGNIYDRNLISFTNRESRKLAVGISSDGRPEVVKASADDELVFDSPIRYSNYTAVHILGYSDLSGIEGAYSGYLEQFHTENKVYFGADAKGKVLDGLPTEVKRTVPETGGVVLTLDRDIQKIAEDAAKSGGLSKGAVVIMDMNGDIIASVSLPDFDPERVEDYLDAPDSPLYNRVFAPYAVGSIFKLTAAATALDVGISPEYTYNCKGFIGVGGSTFNCHSWAGHGVIDIHDAVVTSCNPFFISLTQDLNLQRYYSNIERFGFGESVSLAPGITSHSGNLPTMSELRVPAELANLSFGQGKLTASPLQICRFTVSIANGGTLPPVRLVMGLADDIEGFSSEKPFSHEKPLSSEKPFTPDNPVSGERVMSEQTAAFLRYAMYDTIQKSVQTAIPSNVTAAGKTSTAQTGQFKPDGTEIVRVWFTGFFPYNKPKYAVTVICEDGISGTLTAAPVFSDIAAKITEYEEHKNITEKLL
jgi:penicillin-binding protein 2